MKSVQFPKKNIKECRENLEDGEILYDSEMKDERPKKMAMHKD